MSSDDKYPADSGRRRFVKGVVGGASLSGIAAAGSTAINASTASSGSGGGTTRYVGAENVSGPAPRAMPQIPLELDDEGYLRGIFPDAETVERNGETVTVAETEIGGVTYSNRWFQYCSVQKYPGAQPGAERDNYLRHVTGTYDWQDAHETGDRVHVDDLAGYETWENGIGEPGVGKPAKARWRSEDLPEGRSDQIMPVLLIRSPRIERAAEEREWVRASTAAGVVAILFKCTHFCCVPTFKQIESSAKFDAENEIYCACHQSVYDPLSLVSRVFTALPRPD